MSDTANQHANGLRINANVFRAAFKEARARQLEQAADFMETQAKRIAEIERQLKEREEELAELRRSVDKLNEAVNGRVGAEVNLDVLAAQLKTLFVSRSHIDVRRPSTIEPNGQVVMRDLNDADFKCVSPCMNEDFMRCSCGFQYTEQADVPHKENIERSRHLCSKPPRTQNAGNQTHCAGGNGK